MKVPRVDLTDPSVEPTDAELAALMQAMCDDVVKRHEAAQERFMANVARMIAEASRGGAGTELSDKQASKEPSDTRQEFGT